MLRSNNFALKNLLILRTITTSALSWRWLHKIIYSWQILFKISQRVLILHPILPTFNLKMAYNFNLDPLLFSKLGILTIKTIRLIQKFMNSKMRLRIKISSYSSLESQTARNNFNLRKILGLTKSLRSYQLWDKDILVRC
jgi:hypothetical protein